MGRRSAQRASGRDPVIVPRKPSKTFVKPSLLANPALQQIRSGPAGPRVRFAEPGSPQERIRENLGKPKENEGSRKAPMCFRRGVLIAMWKWTNAGHSFPKIIKNLCKTNTFGEYRFTANPIRPSGAQRALPCTGSLARAHAGGPLLEVPRPPLQAQQLGSHIFPSLPLPKTGTDLL